MTPGRVEASDRNETGARGPVRWWLVVLAGLVVLMVGIGGATRLTGSGLSITEWKPVAGAIPPLSEERWTVEFDKYRASPQYELLNRGMSLGEFKFIFWWEWSHRQLGRLLGLVFFGPLAFFWLKGWVDRRLASALLGIGLLGGLQGAIGWIMVASGLQPGMTAVAPVKLALHLATASLILACLVWVATGLSREEAERVPPGVRRSASGLVALVFAQIVLGGLVAGSRAGFTYNTWPLIDGELVPSAEVLFSRTPWFENFVDNPALVQFDHRLVAYVLVGLALAHALAVARSRPFSAAVRRATVLAGLTLAQMALGIATLVLVVPLWAALGHQLLAMIVLAVAVWHARSCLAEPAPAVEAGSSSLAPPVPEAT